MVLVVQACTLHAGKPMHCCCLTLCSLLRKLSWTTVVLF